MSVVSKTWRLRVVVVLALAWPAFGSASAQSTFPAGSPAAPAAASDHAARARTQGQMITTDQLITLQIKDQLRNNRRFRLADVVVTTEGGLVTILGTMPSEHVRAAALDIARKTPGVVGVNSYLRLLGNSPEAPAPP
jgi:hyperosmotically inducible protein